jgi:hypothetical protein
MINGKILTHCATINTLIVVAIVVAPILALAFAAIVVTALVIPIIALG